MNLNTIRSLLEPVLIQLGYELVLVRSVSEQGRKILRVYIDREGGLSVEDCHKVSREIETLLEVEGVVAERYFLEVSSPGLDRPLVKEADFSRFSGKRAAIVTSTPVPGYGDRRNFKGLLKGMDGTDVIIEIDEEDYRVPFRMIEKANLVY